MSVLASSHTLSGEFSSSLSGEEVRKLRENVAVYKEESEKEIMEDASITHQHQHESGSDPSSPHSPNLSSHSRSISSVRANEDRQELKKQDDISIDNMKNDKDGTQVKNLETAMEKVKVGER